MIPSIEMLHDAGYLSDLDVHMSRTVGRLASETNPLVLLGAAVASRFTLNGHVCVDLGVIAGRSIVLAEGEPLEGMTWPEERPWVQTLRKSPMVCRDPLSPPCPLFLDPGSRLYLYRYWEYEERLVSNLKRRASLMIDPPEPSAVARLEQRLLKDAGGRDRLSPDQRAAVLLTLMRRLVVISGGPGTGKTHTVVRSLGLLAAAAGPDRPLRSMLVAPTGKAADRLRQVLQKARAEDPDILGLLPDNTSTIHRALGTRWDRPAEFRHNAENRLPVDVLVVDEASMVDLALMTKLVEAVPDDARIILVGDRDQLASVECGAILGDLCNAGEHPGFSGPVVEKARSMGLELSQAPANPDSIGLRDSIVYLRKSFRFDGTSGIGRLAAAIQSGRPDEALDIVTQGGDPNLELVTPKGPSHLDEILGPVVQEHFGPGLREDDPGQTLERFGRFRILCGHRKGDFGSEALNRNVERILRIDRSLRRTGPWYPGRPVLVTENDYGLRLFNGDVGVIGEGADGLKAFFAAEEGTLRSVSLARLPAHETAFAMTVHKSQGSEFDEVMVILPERRSPIVTRELLYTAVTRARTKLVILASPEVLVEAIRTPVERASGMREKLWP